MRATLLLAVLAVGCVPSIPDATFVCASDSDCPPNQTCSGGVCHAGAFDGGPSDAGVVIDVGAHDGGPILLDGGVDAYTSDAGSDADLVIVQGTNTFIDDHGPTLVPIDWTTSNVELRYQTSATELSAAISPITIDDSNRGFAGIPDGSILYARRGTGTYLITNHRMIHAGSTNPGRPSEVTATMSGTALELLSVTMLDAWQSTDFIELQASNNGTFITLAGSDLTPAHVAGATQLSMETVSWSMPHQPLLLGSTMMDRLSVFHIAGYTETTASITGTHVTERFLPVSFDLPDDGATHNVGGSFMPLSMDQTASLTWNAPAYEALRAEMGPGVAPPAAAMQATRHIVNYQGLPNRMRGQTLFGGAVDLVVLPTDGTRQVTLDNLHYASPYGADSIVRCVFMQNAMLWRIPTATQSSSFALIQTYAQYDERDASGTLSPVVAPPQNPSVNGMALNGSTVPPYTTMPDVSVSAPIVISWSAPTHLATPTSYTVLLFQGVLTTTAPIGATRRTQIASFEVATGTSFIMPPGVLATDSYYHVLVQSNWRADPTTVSIPAAFATTSSSFFLTTP